MVIGQEAVASSYRRAKNLKCPKFILYQDLRDRPTYVGLNSVVGLLDISYVIYYIQVIPTDIVYRKGKLKLKRVSENGKLVNLK